MGRYITGDIYHKLWFGVQPSDAASQFGGEIDHHYIQYAYHDMGDFDIEALELLICEFNKEFNENVNKSTDPEWFYDWTKKAKIKEKNVPGNLIEMAADLQLGLRIYQRLQEDGSCFFEAEL